MNKPKRETLSLTDGGGTRGLLITDGLPPTFAGLSLEWRAGIELSGPQGSPLACFFDGSTTDCLILNPYVTARWGLILGDQPTVAISRPIAELANLFTAYDCNVLDATLLAHELCSTMESYQKNDVV